MRRPAQGLQTGLYVPAGRAPAVTVRRGRVADRDTGGEVTAAAAAKKKKKKTKKKMMTKKMM